jgi:hypothetical protein
MENNLPKLSILLTGKKIRSIINHAISNELNIFNLEFILTVFF